MPVGSLDDNEHKLKSESIKKYGGFYISRFNISQGSKEKPQSIQGELPWVMISHKEARIVAKSMEKRKSIDSHLTYDEEYDCVLQWLINSRAASYEELYIDSTDLGNYWNFVTLLVYLSCIRAKVTVTNYFIKLLEKFKLYDNIYTDSAYASL